MDTVFNNYQELTNESGTAGLVLFTISIIALLIICVIKKKLTITASFMAFGIGMLVLVAADWTGAGMLLTFFGLSVLATSHKKSLKTNKEELTENGRNAAQVLANGGVAAITSFLVILDPLHAEYYAIMLAASLASALSDTLSSELGMVYGRKFFNIITFKKEASGLDGIISLEGTLIGMVGASVIALLYSGFDRKGLIVAIAGIAGNLMDSVLGAVFERKQTLGNNTVNFLNTLFAALLAMVIYSS